MSNQAASRPLQVALQRRAAPRRPATDARAARRAGRPGTSRPSGSVVNCVSSRSRGGSSASPQLPRPPRSAAAILGLAIGHDRRLDARRARRSKSSASSRQEPLPPARAPARDRRGRARPRGRAPRPRRRGWRGIRRSAAAAGRIVLGQVRAEAVAATARPRAQRLAPDTRSCATVRSNREGVEALRHVEACNNPVIDWFRLMSILHRDGYDNGKASRCRAKLMRPSSQVAGCPAPRLRSPVLLLHGADTWPWRGPLSGIIVRRSHARPRGSLLHDDPRRSRRARDQGRVAGQRRRLAAARPLRQRQVRLLHGNEPRQGEHRARPQGARPTAISSSALLAHADVLVENFRPGAMDGSATAGRRCMPAIRA